MTHSREVQIRREHDPGLRGELDGLFDTFSRRFAWISDHQGVR